MLTIQDVENKEIYQEALMQVKRQLPLLKRLFKKKITKEEAKQITALNIIHTELQNLEFLKYFPNLTALSLNCVTGIKNISGVQYCPDLLDFDLSNSSVESLEDIIYCRKLESFCYDFTKEGYQQYGKADFSFLKKLPKLELISITGNKLEDVSIFADFHTVTELCLCGNPVKNLTSLNQMQSLNYLEVDYCVLESLGNLENFKTLQQLGVFGSLFTEEQACEYKKRYPNIAIFFQD